MKIITSTFQFATQYPKAFLALPEEYQGNDLLDFYIYESGLISAKPQLWQRPAMGNWKMHYNHELNQWFKDEQS